MSTSRDNTVPTILFGSGRDTGLSASVLNPKTSFAVDSDTAPPPLGQTIAEAITEVWKLPHMLDP